jgi:hypothetical protein
VELDVKENSHVLLYDSREFLNLCGPLLPFVLFGTQERMWEDVATFVVITCFGRVVWEAWCSCLGQATLCGLACSGFTGLAAVHLAEMLV